MGGAIRLGQWVGLMDRLGQWVGPADWLTVLGAVYWHSGRSQQTDVAIATFLTDATPDEAGLLNVAGI